MMPETSLEQLVQERQFAGLLQTQAELFFRLGNTLLAIQDRPWNKRHYFQLINEADALETFLDDYGARFNRTYTLFRGLTASLRGFALSGYSVSHLEGRMARYGSLNWPDEDYPRALASLERIQAFLRRTVARLLEEIRSEAGSLGVEITPESFPEANFLPIVARRCLPRNLGEAELVDEEQKIAEVATRYIRACEALARIGIRSMDDPRERASFFARYCTEERARTCEASIHNLQSSYDTHIQNTVLEAQDERLPRLRAHVSAALHLVEAVTHLAHFMERHEDQGRDEAAKARIGALVPPAEVHAIVINELLVWVHHHMQSGYPIAAELLPSYTKVERLTIELPERLRLHARPAALLVRVVNHFGTPVEMTIGGRSCNAGSILELLVAAGSQPEERTLVFHGDQRPLRDIQLLIEQELGENGMDRFPPELDYLKG